MNHASLFSGIGAPDYAAELMGWENVFHCEINEFCQRVLKYYWPKAISYNDIKQTDFSVHRGFIDILTGGFPCQPYSQAGSRLGKEDDRHLWPEMLRAIREIQPTWVVGENVRGLINWNGGMVFDEVQADLEAAGYEVLPVLLPAAGVNAPHERYRIFFVAHTKSELLGKKRDGLFGSEEWNHRIGDERFITNSDNKRLERSAIERIQTFEGGGRNNIQNGFSSGLRWCDWEGFPTQSPLCNGDDGISPQLDGITFPKWRTESIKAGGNAIVPQVILQIFKAIESYN